MAVVDLTQARKMAVALLNLTDGGSAYGTISSERITQGEIDDELLAGDASVCRSICNVKGHGRRKDFFKSPAAVAHAAQIASHVGPVESLQFVISGGKYTGTHGVESLGMDYFGKLTDEIRNVLNNPYIRPHCILDGDTVYHNAAGLIRGGASVVTFNVVACDFILTTACQSPSEFLRPVAAAGLALAIIKDGQRVSAGQLLQTIYQQEMGNLGVPDAMQPQTDERAA